MKTITEIDLLLTDAFADFNDIAKQLQMEYVCCLSDAKTIALQNYEGLYQIDVRTENGPADVKQWISALRLEWEHPDFLKKFTANFKEKRIRQHTTLPEWMPLYIGKSKQVGKRVWEHINLDLTKSTFAMKIKARPTMAARQFRLSTFRLDVKNYNIIAPALESAFRDRINPLIGKQ